jgi:hypothetical protein
MDNHQDLILDVNSDKERYYITYDQNGNPVPVLVNLTAKLTEGGENANQNEHIITDGHPVDDAIVLVKITSPDYGQTIRQLVNQGNGIYTASFATPDLGQYNMEFNASDDTSNGNYNNSKYLITAEHSIYVAPQVDPQSLSAKTYVQWAYNNLTGIISQYCPTNNNCTLNSNTKKDINNAISYLSASLTYFLSGDGNHLKVNKGLTFYANLSSAVNKVYTYISDPRFGSRIDQAIEWLKLAGYKIAVTARDDAMQPGACVVSNCASLLESCNTELGKALDSLKQENYAYVFNHLTNAWKFAENMMGANLNKPGGDEAAIPTKYALDQNYPNPFNPTTKINYQLPEHSHATLKIYDILGNLVTTLVDQEQEPGYYTVEWNASQYASGVYFYRFVSGSFTSTKKLMLLK